MAASLVLCQRSGVRAPPDLLTAPEPVVQYGAGARCAIDERGPVDRVSGGNLKRSDRSAFQANGTSAGWIWYFFEVTPR
jgi:hypothetical protein